MRTTTLDPRGRADAPALVVSGLAKTFRDSWGRRVQALRDVSLEVPPGEIFGLLGPNGAGKSTTLKIVLGLFRADRGEGRLLGESLGSVSVRRRIGFLPENPYFYDHLTATELLDTWASLSELPKRGRKERIRRMLERVGLDPAERRVLRKYSKGMLQRVGLAQALLHEPDLVILDEPMSGLDPIGRRQVRDLILALKSEGKTVILSSHVLSDVEALADRVGILSKGVLVRTGRLGDLVTPGRDGFEIEAAELPDSLVESWSADRVSRRSGDRILVKAADRAELKERVLQVFRSGGALLAVRPLHASLEDLFLASLGTETRHPGVERGSVERRRAA